MLLFIGQIYNKYIGEIFIIFPIFYLGKIDKLKYYGLFLFVAIPLPTTGAWTGSLIAALLGLDKKKSWLAASLGVIAAGLIMLVVSFGILGGMCK